MYACMEAMPAKSSWPCLCKSSANGDGLGAIGDGEVGSVLLINKERLRDLEGGRSEELASAAIAASSKCGHGRKQQHNRRGSDAGSRPR